MVINSVLNEGLAGMQQSQKKMQQAAQDIVSAGAPRDHTELNPNATGATPVTDAGVAAPDLPAREAVEAGSENAPAAGTYSSLHGDVTEPLLEQKKQQLMFDASARVFKAGHETLGSIIDDMS